MMPKPFEQWLKEQPRAKVSQEDFLRGFAEAHPEWAQEGNFSKRVLTALQALQEVGVLRLPRGKQHYDQAGEPRLPFFVTVAREAKVVAAKPQDIVWVPELAFATTLTHASRIEKLATLNRFIIGNRELIREYIPYRERSLQIFGDEKALDRMLEQNGKIFGEVELSAIGAMEPEVPLVIEYSGLTHAPVLLLENHHTYWSCVQWNRTARQYSAVAYGNGNAILGAPLGLIRAARQVQAPLIAYFGDLDPKGVEIATKLAARVEARNGPPVMPALPLYYLAMNSGIRRLLGAGKQSYSGESLDWLEGLTDEVTALFLANQWIPQESVSTQRLRLLTAEGLASPETREGILPQELLEALRSYTPGPSPTATSKEQIQALFEL